MQNDLIHLERCDVVDYYKDAKGQIYWAFWAEVEQGKDKIQGPFANEEDAYWDVLLKYRLWSV